MGQGTTGEMSCIRFDPRKADELGCKCAAMIRLVNPFRNRMESAEQYEFIGANLLERDNELPKGVKVVS